jgi:hypothetical protein
MKKGRLIYVTMSIFFGSTLAFAQYNDNQQGNDQASPPGMETKKVGNEVSVLMPTGTKMHQLNKSTYVQESADEYAARQFLGIENRLNKLEQENRALVEEVRYLRSKLILQEKSTEEDVPAIAEE